METFLYIGLGGFLGANVRYVLAGWVSRTLTELFGWSFPFGTMFVNVTGSCLLAMFVVWSSSHLDLSPNVRLMVSTGFFGAYTTFSTFANESMSLWIAGDWNGFFGNLVITNIACLFGVAVGLLFAYRLWSVG